MTARKGNTTELSSRDWFGKVSAAFVLGFTLSLALTCTFAILFSSGSAYFSAQGQIAMWLMAPIWCAVLSLCFLFRSTARAWSWLAAANLLVWLLYAAIRLLRV